MYQILETGFGNFRMLSFFTTLGTIFAILACGTVIYLRTKKIKEVFLGVLIAGGLMSVSYPGQVLKSLNRMNFSTGAEFIQKVFLHPSGNHFLGRVLVMAVFLPWVYRIAVSITEKNKDFGLVREERVQNFLDGAGIMIVVQHFFSRIGCFCNGCCYGKPYQGIGAVTYPKDVLGYSVYPSQCMEVFLMGVLFFWVLWHFKHKKPFFSVVLMGFGITIFLSEFFMSQEGIGLIFGMNIIQYAAIVLIFIGIFRRFAEKKHLPIH